MDYFLKNFSDSIGISSVMSWSELMGIFISALLSLLGFFFLCQAVYGGCRWISAAGDKNKELKAKEALRGSITGLIIILASYAVTLYIFNIMANSP